MGSERLPVAAVVSTIPGRTGSPATVALASAAALAPVSAASVATGSPSPTTPGCLLPTAAACGTVPLPVGYPFCAPEGRGGRTASVGPFALWSFRAMLSTHAFPRLFLRVAAATRRRYR